MAAGKPGSLVGRNVEIKARVSDLALIQKRAEMIADSGPSVRRILIC